MDAKGRLLFSSKPVALDAKQTTMANANGVALCRAALADLEPWRKAEADMPSGNRDRLVDCMEEFVKYTIVMRPHFHLFEDRFSERTERMAAREKARQQELQANAATKHVTRLTNGATPVNGVDINRL